MSNIEVVRSNISNQIRLQPSWSPLIIIGLVINTVLINLLSKYTLMV